MSEIDFTKVEALRKHMLLTTVNMAQLLGVSRVTYYSWVKGGAVRRENQQRVRRVLRQLLDIMTTHGWPQPHIIASTPKQRMEALLELLVDEQ